MSIAQMDASAAYVDGSALVSIALRERNGPEIAQRLNGYAGLYSSILLEAEVRAVFAREQRAYDPNFLSEITWVFPDRSLGPEIAEVLRVRYLRSGDLLHVATALYASRTRDMALAFITLDQNQQEAAAGLGFAT